MVKISLSVDDNISEFQLGCLVGARAGGGALYDHVAADSQNRLPAAPAGGGL